MMWINNFYDFLQTKLVPNRIESLDILMWYPNTFCSKTRFHCTQRTSSKNINTKELLLPSCEGVHNHFYYVWCDPIARHDWFSQPWSLPLLFSETCYYLFTVMSLCKFNVTQFPGKPLYKLRYWDNTWSSFLILS